MTSQYKCPTCSKMCSAESSLVKHQGYRCVGNKSGVVDMIKPPDKTLSCEYCDVAYNSPSELRVHTCTHTLPRSVARGCSKTMPEGTRTNSRSCASSAAINSQTGPTTVHLQVHSAGKKHHYSPTQPLKLLLLLYIYYLFIFYYVF